MKKQNRSIGFENSIPLPHQQKSQFSSVFQKNNLKLSISIIRQDLT